MDSMGYIVTFLTCVSLNVFLTLGHGRWPKVVGLFFGHQIYPLKRKQRRHGCLLSPWILACLMLGPEERRGRSGEIRTSLDIQTVCFCVVIVVAVQTEHWPKGSEM